MTEQLKISRFRNKPGYVLVLESSNGRTVPLVEFYEGGIVFDMCADDQAWARARAAGPMHLFLLAEIVRELNARRLGGEALDAEMQRLGDWVTLAEFRAAQPAQA